MILTIHEGRDKSYIMVVAKAENRYFSVQTKDLYNQLVEIASYYNNERGETCLFEIE